MSTTGPQTPGPNSAEDHTETYPELAYWVRQIANGDHDAEACMWAFWRFNHLYDDLVDQDKPVTLEQAAKVLAEFTTTLTLNSFWQAYGRQLLPLYLSCINRWVDGEDWPDKKQAAVIRCGDVDFMLQFALYTGGWDHLRACKAARSYDKED